MSALTSPETAVHPPVDPEILVVSDVVGCPGNPQKVFICSRGFTEADWNTAYSAWCDAVHYHEESDSDFNESDFPKKKGKSAENANGVLGEVDELDLVELEPETIPTHINNLFTKFNPGGKRKRRDLTFRHKYALLKWMDYVYPNGKYNFSQNFETNISGQENYQRNGEGQRIYCIQS